MNFPEFILFFQGPGEFPLNLRMSAEGVSCSPTLLFSGIFPEKIKKSGPGRLPDQSDHTSPYGQRTAASEGCFLEGKAESGGIYPKQSVRFQNA